MPDVPFWFWDEADAVRQHTEPVPSRQGHRSQAIQKSDSEQKTQIGRQDAERSPQVELLERDSLMFFLLSQEQDGDEEAADHEEHVDAQTPQLREMPRA